MYASCIYPVDVPSVDTSTTTRTILSWFNIPCFGALDGLSGSLCMKRNGSDRLQNLSAVMSCASLFPLSWSCFLTFIPVFVLGSFSPISFSPVCRVLVVWTPASDAGGGASALKYDGCSWNFRADPNSTVNDFFAIVVPIAICGASRRCIWMVTLHLSKRHASNSITIKQRTPKRRDGGIGMVFVRLSGNGSRWLLKLRSCSALKNMITRSLGSLLLQHMILTMPEPLLTTKRINFGRPLQSFYLLSNWTYWGREGHFEYCRQTEGRHIIVLWQNVRVYTVTENTQEHAFDFCPAHASVLVDWIWWLPCTLGAFSTGGILSFWFGDSAATGEVLVWSRVVMELSVLTVFQYLGMCLGGHVSFNCNEECWRQNGHFILELLVIMGGDASMDSGCPCFWRADRSNRFVQLLLLQYPMKCTGRVVPRWILGFQIGEKLTRYSTFLKVVQCHCVRVLLMTTFHSLVEHFCLRCS